MKELMSASFGAWGDALPEPLVRNEPPSRVDEEVGPAILQMRYFELAQLS
jgi:hypothetical protein